MIILPHPWISDTFPVALSAHTQATEGRGRSRFAPVNPFAPAEGGSLTIVMPTLRGVRRLNSGEGELAVPLEPPLFP